ncbi:hypothetical protein F5Y12DRAFT_757175 [Xylaria sp. FL1777]|nr:hypothetical protein F5Y12DRAFT_757175 [Xylaria sp. FL1777]
MCRRTITHYMHHDVAAPMILDPVASDPIVYANPLRTNLHTCELMHPLQDWLLNTPIQKCNYHTCCVSHVQVDYCADLIAYLDEEGEEQNFEPEECDAYILEHRHERLPYFGNDGAFREKIPATWRDLKQIGGENPNWFAHEPRFYTSWAEKCFAEGEKLYTLEQDTTMLYASMQDLLELSSICSWSTVQAVRGNVLEAERKLHEQRRLVFDIFQWAREPCCSCNGRNL